MLSEGVFSIIGHVGANPEVKAIKGGRRCRFPIWRNETWRDGAGERQERGKKVWVTVLEWEPKSGQPRQRRTLVQVIEEHVRSGAYVRVKGDLEPNTFQTSGGQTIETVDLVVTSLDFLERKDNAGEPPADYRSED